MINIKKLQYKDAKLDMKLFTNSVNITLFAHKSTIF